MLSAGRAPSFPHACMSLFALVPTSSSQELQPQLPSARRCSGLCFTGATTAHILSYSSSLRIKALLNRLLACNQPTEMVIWSFFLKKRKCRYFLVFSHQVPAQFLYGTRRESIEVNKSSKHSPSLCLISFTIKPREEN